MELNCDLVRALGVDAKNCARVVMVVEPGELPKLHITKHVRTADGLQTAVEMLRLKPVADDAPLDAEGRPEPVVQYLGEVQRLQMKPGDAVVLSCERSISDEVHSRLRQYMETMFPGRTVVVLSDGLKLGVIGAAPAPQLHVPGEPDPFAEYGPTVMTPQYL